MAMPATLPHIRGYAEKQTYLDVGEREVVADEGPGGFQCAEEEFVNELDEQKAEYDRAARRGRGF